MGQTLLSVLYTLNYSILAKSYEFDANINTILQIGRRLGYSKFK